MPRDNREHVNGHGVKRRFLLDQMLDADVRRSLLDAGFDAEGVALLGLARATDDEILSVAIERGDVLVTLDEHFGDWAVLPLERHPGVIRVKANPATTDNILDVLLPFLRISTNDALENTLVIASRRGVRRIKTGLR